MEVRRNSFEEKLYRKNPRGPDYLESMLSRFNRMVSGSGLFRELKKRQYFEKPSDIRRREQREADLRYKRKEKENALHNKRFKRSS